MRLFVQACLIFIFSYSPFSNAASGNYPTVTEAMSACLAAYGTSNTTYSCQTRPGTYYVRFYVGDSMSYWGDTFFFPNPDSCQAPNVVNEDGFCDIPPAPVCESPNYIDDATGECVAPEEICFTSIESMSDRCVFIGETTPEAPPGCIRDEETQAEICLSENEGCYVADGKEICPTPGMVCGVKNGTFSCVAPEQEGCGYFNGERVCFTPDGDKVEPDSPDHPDNGGNLDGDDTNDPTDPRTPEEGGNPDNQPIDTTGQGEGATEGTAKEQLKALRDLRDDTRNQNKANEGNGAAIEQGISSDIGSAGDSATGQLDDHIDGIDTTAPMTADDLSGVESTVSNLFGVSTQCTDIVFGTQELFYTITCQQMDKIRDLLGFLLYGFTVIRLFQIAVRPAAKGTP